MFERLEYELLAVLTQSEPHPHLGPFQLLTDWGNKIGFWLIIIIAVSSSVSKFGVVVLGHGAVAIIRLLVKDALWECRAKIDCCYDSDVFKVEIALCLGDKWSFDMLCLQEW